MYNLTSYPTPSHLKNVSQHSIPDDLGRIAEINVVTTVLGSRIEDVVEHSPTFDIVALQLVINPHHPS
jgi:hypothetical protein